MRTWNFTELSELLKKYWTALMPSKCGDVSAAISCVIQHAVDSHAGLSDERKYLQLINLIMYRYLTEPTFHYGNTFHWMDEDDSFDFSEISEALGDAYVTRSSVFWDIDDEDDESYEPQHIESVKAETRTPISEHTYDIKPAPQRSEVSSVSSRSKGSSKAEPMYDGDKILEMLQSDYYGSTSNTDVGVDADDNMKLFYLGSTSDGIPITTDRSSQSLVLPEIPGSDMTQIFWKCHDWCGRDMEMHPTLPYIPTCPREVSVTTNVDRMIDRDFIALYPDKVIRARHEKMYSTGITTNMFGDEVELDMDEVLGYIPKISGYSRNQVIDNIIKYPIFAYWYRDSNGDYNREEFLDRPELDGELLSRQDWIDKYSKENDDLRNLPNHKAFIYDYLFRKYILDEENGKPHKYPIQGTFGPYMVLWMPPEVYIKYGYADIVGMARQCVQNRIEFYRTRNPIFMHAQKVENSGFQPVADEHRYCPFAAACDSPRCDYSCNRTSTLEAMIRHSEIDPNRLGKVSPEAISMIESYMQKFSGRTGMVLCNKDSKWLADLYSWVAICKLSRYYGSDIAVFHLNFNQYVQNIRSGNWGRGESERMSLMRYFIRTARVLVISGLEYIQWYDTESQTLLQVIGDRERNSNFSTVIVGRHPKDYMTPYTHRPFAARVYEVLEEILAGRKSRW